MRADSGARKAKRMAALTTLGPVWRVRWTQALLAWWYGRPMLKRYKPLVRAEFAAGDQIAEARFLAEAGYHVAALGLARTALEARIRRAAILSPAWQRVRKDQTPQWASEFMFKQGLWPQEMHRRYRKVYSLLSNVVHSGRVEPLRVWELLDRSKAMMVELDALVVKTLHS